MAETSETLAAELGVSSRQILNYKDAVERHISKPITYRQGKQHYYHDRYLPLLRLYSEGKPLPPVEEQPSNPFPPVEEPALEGAIVLKTRSIPAPVPLEACPVEILSVDVAPVDAATDRNLMLAEQFKSAITQQVLAEADSFGLQLQAQVKQIISRRVAQGYRETIR